MYWSRWADSPATAAAISALYRFIANKRAALAFCAGLIQEFGEFPTDPAAVHPGEPA